MPWQIHNGLLCAVDIHAVLDHKRTNKKPNQTNKPSEKPHIRFVKNHIKTMYFKYYYSPNGNNLLLQAFLSPIDLPHFLLSLPTFKLLLLLL